MLYRFTFTGPLPFIYVCGPAGPFSLTGPFPGYLNGPVVLDDVTFTLDSRLKFSSFGLGGYNIYFWLTELLKTTIMQNFIEIIVVNNFCSS